MGRKKTAIEHEKGESLLMQSIIKDPLWLTLYNFLATLLLRIRRHLHTGAKLRMMHFLELEHSNPKSLLLSVEITAFGHAINSSKTLFVESINIINPSES